MRNNIEGKTQEGAPRFESGEIVARINIEEFLSFDQAHEFFVLDGGVLKNRTARGRRAKVGQIAGTSNGDGYLRVRVNGYQFRVHRIIWLMTYGCWPKGQIDHINGMRDDNRPENMRDVDSQGNQRNQHIRVDNTSGITGVSLENGRWTARIKIDGQRYRLGRYRTRDEALAARHAAQVVAGFHPNHGGTDEARKNGSRSKSSPQLMRIA